MVIRPFDLNPMAEGKACIMDGMNPRDCCQKDKKYYSKKSTGKIQRLSWIEREKYDYITPVTIHKDMHRYKIESSLIHDLFVR